MSVTPNCFLNFSKAALNENDEFSKRNSLSRAYYAAYHLAKKYFSTLSTEENNVGMHKAFIDALMMHPQDSLERKVGIQLQTLHSRRVKADYKIHLTIPISDPAMQISAVENVFKLLSK